VSPDRDAPPPEANPPQVPEVAAEAQWGRLGNWLLAFLGAGFLAAALIFFFAYNWAEMHRFAKFGIGLAALATAAGFAIFGRHTGVGVRRRAALFATTLCTGALLALIGQTYQTGADLWELFAVWALLATPFALLSRSVETWALWLAIANTALYLRLGTAWAFVSGSASPARPLFWGIAFNVVCLLLAERFARAPHFTPARALPRLAALVALGGLCTGACIGLFSPEEYVHFVPLYIAAAALTLTLYRHTRFDSVMLGIGGTSVIVFGTLVLAKLVDAPRGHTPIELLGLLCGGFLIVSSGLLTAWLIKLHRERHAATPQTPPRAEAAANTAPPQVAGQGSPDSVPIATAPSTLFDVAADDAAPSAHTPPTSPATAPPAPAGADAAPPPIWIAVLQGVAAWIAALILGGSLSSPFLSSASEGGLGLGFTGAALALYYKARRTVFFEQAALALSATGQCFIFIQCMDSWRISDSGSAFAVSLVVALGLFALRTPPLHRTLCLVWAGICLYGALGPSLHANMGMEIGFSALAILLWLARPRWATHTQATSLLALTHAASLLAWSFLFWNYLYAQHIPRDDAAISSVGPHLYATVTLALLLGLVVWLCRPLYAAARTSPRARALAALLLCAAALYATVAYREPALSLCAALLLATYAVRRLAWFTAYLVALPILVWQLYYNLEQSLLARSLSLALVGALLLGLRQAVAALSEPPRVSTAEAHAQTAPPPRGQQWAIAAAASLVVVLALYAIWDNERTLTHGQPVLVRLRPVDPRSLMQGDYMALAYELDRDARPPDSRRRGKARNTLAEPRPPRYAYLVLDEASRATALHSTGHAPTPRPLGNTVAIKLRGEPRFPQIGPNAFFFQEGHGDVYETAQWAELRVAPSGKALLLNLRNDALEILGEPQR